MIYSDADREIVQRGFYAAYNGRHQRVLKTLSPEIVLRQRLGTGPVLINQTYRDGSQNLNQPTLGIVAQAKKVSHSDS